MNWHALFVTVIGTVMPAAFMQMFPFWQRTFFFTVRVPEGFSETEAGRGIVRGFRLAALALSFACGLAMYAGIMSQMFWLTMPAPLLNSAMLIVLLQWARSRTLPYGAPPAGTVRRAALGGDEGDQPWWAWAAPLASLAIMGTAAAFVSTHWNELPERFPCIGASTASRTAGIPRASEGYTGSSVSDWPCRRCCHSFFMR
jgi:hypothetical protein